MDPSEDDISQVIDFAGLNPIDDRSMVINALKSNSRNVETVVMQFFDNPENFRQKYLAAWSEAMFSADRDGSTNNAAFHIESANQDDCLQGATPPPPGYAVGAPSRPPSRSNDRSPLGRMVEWTAGDATGGAPLHSQEDEDMQRALRESAQEAGIALSSSHETGIAEAATGSTYFGPANRPDYDQGSWAMVPLGTGGMKRSEELRPSARRRVADAPAFLTSGNTVAGTHRLGGMLTILHEIPLARNILLQCGASAESYGCNNEWWKGQAIISPETLQRLQDPETQWNPQAETRKDFEEEIHRLLAFLDSTERSHATVGPLIELMEEAVGRGPEKAFFEQLLRQSEDTVKPLCQAATLTSVHGEDLPSEESIFGLLELDHVRSEYDNIKTLYESFDHIMWADVLTWNEIRENPRMAMFTQMGEVLAIKCGSDGPETSIDIPLELYPAKYLVAQKEEARRIQFAWNKTKHAVAEILEEQKKLQEWQNDWRQQEVDKNGLMGRIRSQWEAMREYLKSSGHFQAMEVSGFDTIKYPDYRAAPCQMTEDQKRSRGQVEDVLSLTERVLLDVEEKAKGLRARLEQTQAKQRFLGRLLTVPDKPGRPKAMECKKYLLRGVATDGDVIYVCRRAEHDLIELEGVPAAPLEQWWRLAYVANDIQQPVKAEKIEVERVLREMWQETKNPLVIYATESSLDVPRAPLTSALSQFVAQDNAAFKQELSQQSARSSEERGRGPLDPLSPSKRKHRADSADSMNTNRASLGSDDRGDFENPFEDRMESIDVELSNLSNGRVGDDIIKSRVPGGVGGESATLTPDTLAEEEGDKAPEMKERSRGLTFMKTGEGEGVGVGVDMDMPERL